MGEWAKRKLDELERREGEGREVLQAHTLDRQQIVAEAPYLWRELRKCLKDEIEEVNSSRPNFTYREVHKKARTSFVVIGSPEWEVELTFDGESPRIFYERRETPGPMARIGVESEGSFVFTHRGAHVGLQEKNDKSVVGPPALAECLLNLIA